MNKYDLPIWEHPADYGGFSPDGDYLVYSRNRDSTILENSNYELILKELTELGDTLDPEMTTNGKPLAYDFRAGHWAVGWVEYILISKDSPDKLQAAAAEIIEALFNYPIYSVSDYSERQCDAISNYWDRCSMRERLEWCADAGVSPFAARPNHAINSAVWDQLCESEMFF